MYENDSRIVLTLDAGGTNFVFSALQGNKSIVEPVSMPSNADNLDRCLKTIVEGFERVISQVSGSVAAISFAFPGPADYRNGVICKLPNLPAFSDGDVALGAYIEKYFNVPVFINNDGALFAYGEAMAGALPYVNTLLEKHGSARRYKNLLGLTFGTGFGGGVVINDSLLVGDNCCGGSVWVFRNKLNPQFINEENVSIRAVKRIYAQYSGSDEELTPLDIYNIAEGTKSGDREAAIKAFDELGVVAGDTIAIANTVVDGLVVIGGGLAGAQKYFMQPLVDEINGTIATASGAEFPRSQAVAYNLEDEGQLKEFLEKDFTKSVSIPGSLECVTYTQQKSFGVIISRLGASTAISIGAYAYALSQMDRK